MYIIYVCNAHVYRQQQVVHQKASSVTLSPVQTLPYKLKRKDSDFLPIYSNLPRHKDINYQKK